MTTRMSRTNDAYALGVAAGKRHADMKLAFAWANADYAAIEAGFQKNVTLRAKFCAGYEDGFKTGGSK